MTRRLSFSGYLCVFLWSAWFFALQGVAAQGSLGVWTPDLGLVLLLAIDARATNGDARRAALLVSLARSTFSSDSTAAIVTGYLGVVGITSALREGLEIDGLLLRGLTAGLFGAGLAAWWLVCQRLVVAPDGVGAVLSISPGDVWPTAATTALAAFFFGPLLVGLPGFASVRGRGRR